MWRLIIAAHPSDAATASVVNQSSAASTLSFSSIASTQESRVVSALSSCVGLRLDPKSRDQRRLALAFKFASLALEVEHRTIKDENKRTWCASVSYISICLFCECFMVLIFFFTAAAAIHLIG